MKKGAEDLLDLILVAFFAVWGVGAFVFFVIVSAHALYRGLLFVTGNDFVSLFGAFLAAVVGTIFATMAMGHLAEHK